MEFKQLVLWLGTYLGNDSSVDEFEEYFKETLGFTVKYHSEFTLNNPNKNKCILFYINSEDIPKFSLFRITTSDMKWFEDYVENNPEEIPDDIMELYEDYMKK